MEAIARSHAPELAARADELAGCNVFERVEEGSRFLQPALFCASLAGWRALLEDRPELRDGVHVALAGHSLGEFAATVAAGALAPEEGLALVELRGRLFDEAADDDGRGGMLAVIGPRATETADLAPDGVWLANDNAPTQLVFAGRPEPLDDFEQRALDTGCRVMRLPLQVAAHTPLMHATEERLAAALERAAAARPSPPVWSPCTVSPMRDVARDLAASVSRPVRFRHLLTRLHAEGARTFVETGPGEVLTKLALKTLDGIDTKPRWRSRMFDTTETTYALSERENRNGPRVPRGAAIGSVAVAMPEQVIDNDPIAERLGVEPDWIVKRMGVRSRHMARPGESLTALAAEAGCRAVAQAGKRVEEIDTVLVATSTGDELLPNAAPLVATAMGIPQPGAFDVGAACAGFLSALSTASALVETGRSSNCLVIGAEFPSRVLNRDDRRTAGLMGDGCGAVVVSAVEGETRVGPSLFRSDGRFKELAKIERDDQTFVMQGQETFQIAVKELTAITHDLLASSGLTLEDIDLFVYHQANGRILQAVGQRLDLPPQKVVDVVARTGNTSAASIPIGLHAAEADGRLRPGARVFMATIGTGFVWGAVIAEWGASR
jgi:3-oxoacyl-[acyl-carrier-protein] synthase-3